MIEVHGDLWSYPADAICITTNGIVKKDGSAVMGAGSALEAAKRYPELPLALGQAITSFGNEAFWIPVGGTVIVTLPTKYHWRDKSSIELITRSARKIVQMPALRGDRVIVVPRPGCGLGGLCWQDVKLVLAPILDDRFHIITR